VKVIRSYRVPAGAYTIRVSPGPAVVALVMLALLLSAGFWQLRRADEKRAILVEQAYRGDKEALVLGPDMAGNETLSRLRHRLAVATGHYRGDIQYLLDNRTHNQIAGYYVLTPMRLAESDLHVLVNRGWLPVGPDRGRLPDVSVTGELSRAEGTIVAPPASGIALGPAGFDEPGWPKVVQQAAMDRVGEQLESPLLPFVLRLSPDSTSGYTREWQVRTGLTPERHMGYAVQWFALAAALVVLCLWVATKRNPPGSTHER
jgi:surfeit locus 1 family protein